MPTNNKTTNLELNSWLATDKPKREDFVSDNEILDTTIYTHISDAVKHLTQSDRNSFSTSCEIDIIGGDGAATQTHLLSFSPKMVFVCLVSNPLVEYSAGDNNYNIINCGVGLGGSMGGSLGVSLIGDLLTLTQTQSTPNDGRFINLNKTNGQYLCVMFK